MKKILFFLLVSISCLIAKGQDQIITKAGDTLNCKITRISSGYIHFQISDATGPIRSRIERSNVLSFYQAEEPQQPQGQIGDPKTEEEVGISDRFADLIESNRFRIVLNTGFTYQFGGYENHPTSYARQLRTFVHLGADIQFFPTDRFGVGLKYNRTSTPAQENFDPSFAQAFGTNSIEEKVRFHYVGFSLLSRQPRGSDQYLIYSIAGGKVMYRDDGFKDNNVPYFEHGDSFALELAIGYDYILDSNLAVGVGFALNIGRINEYETPSGTVNGANFDVSRFDLTLGLRFLK